MVETKEYLNYEEAAALISVSIPKFNELAKAANLTVYTFEHDRRQRLYRVEDVKALIGPPVPVAAATGEGA